MRPTSKSSVYGPAAIATALIAISASPASAYIDPGTGSMLLQVIGASVAGAMFYFRELRMKFLAMFGRRTTRVADTSNSTPSDSSRG